MKLIDAHTHVSCPDFQEDRTEVLKRAFEVCDYLIDIGAGTEAGAHQRAKELAENNESIYFTAGVHPHDAEELGQDPKLRKEIEALLPHPKCVAVGECGLDYFYDHSPREAQMEVFRWQIELAQKHELPLMIHTRNAEDDTKQLLRDYTGKGIFHCFTGSKDLADFGLKKDFMISFSAIPSFKKADELRELFVSLPVENILTETDAPYLAPAPMRGKRNEPSFIKYTAEFLANQKKLALDDFVQTTHRNALKVFHKITS